jgi:hypothetical protein
MDNQSTKGGESMSKPKKNKPIKPLEGYTVMSDEDVASRGMAVETGMTGNSHFPTPPVDLAALKANIESFRALIAEVLDGSKKVIAQKDKQREAVIKMLRLLGRYVEVTSDGGMAIFTSSGFQAARRVADVNALQMTEAGRDFQADNCLVQPNYLLHFGR